MLPENIVQLALKSRKEGLTAEEREFLNQWLLENVELQEELHQLVECGSVVQAARLFENIQIRNAWQNVEQKLSSRPGWKKRHLTIRWSVAATVVIMLTAGWFLFRQSPVRTEPEKLARITPGSLKAIWVLEGGEKYELSENLGRDITNSGGVTIGKNSLNTLVIQEGNSRQRSTVRVPEGGEYRVVLSDGTKVWINSGSELTSPMNFEKGERVVELKGEAYFDVIKSKEWPFIVRTCRSSVKVLGTSFNVCSYEGDALEQVTLEQGGVEVKHHDETYLLHPGEQFELDTRNEEIEVKPVNVKLYTSWIDGMFRFHNMPLDLLTVKLERWYNVHFVFSNEVCKNYRFTGAIRKDVDFNEFIRLIERTTNVKFIIKQKNIIIQEK